MTITSAVAGKITVDMKDVRTFASDGPLAIKLKDGTLIHQQVATAQDGQIALAPGGALQPQNVALATIKTVNFKEDWTGSLTVGGQLARGNTNTDTLNDAVSRQTSSPQRAFRPETPTRCVQQFEDSQLEAAEHAGQVSA